MIVQELLESGRLVWRFRARPHTINLYRQKENDLILHYLQPAPVGRKGEESKDWFVLLDEALYDRELLEYMAQDAVVRQGLLGALTPAAVAWMETRLVELGRTPNANYSMLLPSLFTIAESAKADSKSGAQRKKGGGK